MSWYVEPGFPQGRREHKFESHQELILYSCFEYALSFAVIEVMTQVSFANRSI